MRVGLLVATVFVTVLVGCGGKTVAGKYHIEQDGTGFGEGAEKTELDLRADKSFDVTLGPLKMFEGTWSEANSEITLTSSGAADKIATSYKIKEGKLIPQVAGKEVAFWRWVPKS